MADAVTGQTWMCVVAEGFSVAASAIEMRSKPLEEHCSHVSLLGWRDKC